MFPLLFAAHIYFDDAFEMSNVNEDWSQVNDFVKTFVNSIDEAASYVHQVLKKQPDYKEVFIDAFFRWIESYVGWFFSRKAVSNPW